MMARQFGRRRALRIVAGLGALCLAPGLAGARPRARVTTWHGTALGAEASIILAHEDEGAARDLIRRAVAEIARLEKVFSLYRADSALSRLNRHGVLDAPPLDLVRLLAEARRFGDLTDGAFDVTVQPLWGVYANHFAAPGADPDGPDAEAIAEALARVDYRAVSVESHRIGFARPGMAVTLNGIAQGYITDRVADLLRRAGLDNVLIDLGETRALGRHPDGRPWRVGLRDPLDREAIVRDLDLTNAALATSAGAGTRFDAHGRHHHLLDPRTGRSAQRYLSVSVIADTATAADALSTGFSIADIATIESAIAGRRPITAILTPPDGQAVTLGS